MRHRRGLRSLSISLLLWPNDQTGVMTGVVEGEVVAVVVTRNKNRENAYPDYTKLNYTLLETYSGESFFDNFNYYIGYDPAHGFVHYVPKETATQLNLTYASSSSAVLKVDTSVTNASVPNASTGRFSVRVESKSQYPVGTLFLFDVQHTPYGCGTWPALWLSDPDPAVWPAHGEIDVFEATNQGDRGNTVSLHTTQDCDMSDVKRLMTGEAGQGDCYNGTNSNTGCGVSAQSTSTYGAAFNSGGGGVMAVELRDAGIRVWSWLRSALPTDVKAGTVPDPSSWGTAFADFPNTDCDISSHFKNQSIIANIDLCGDLVEATWNDSGCASTCSDWVANYPQAFNNAYWEFGAFKVYQAL
ncbi:glycoside hydrolase family 16 protein [Coniochaeta sp. PMI_546]|nr:glycoside hydrolase family 16 protein [Coniochaeta sp. PMI_546]